jgi:hypothetical protein
MMVMELQMQVVSVLLGDWSAQMVNGGSAELSAHAEAVSR